MATTNNPKDIATAGEVDFSRTLEIGKAGTALGLEAETVNNMVARAKTELDAAAAQMLSYVSDGNNQSMPGFVFARIMPGEDGKSPVLLVTAATPGHSLIVANTIREQVMEIMVGRAGAASATLGE